jgi:hypothetical protein
MLGFQGNCPADVQGVPNMQVGLQMSEVGVFLLSFYKFVRIQIYRRQCLLEKTPGLFFLREGVLVRSFVIWILLHSCMLKYIQTKHTWYNVKHYLWRFLKI